LGISKWSKLNFKRTVKPVENAFSESFNGRLRDEFLNTEVLFNIADARKKLEEWKNDYNYSRPHSALEGLSQADLASTL
jgi:putative transposase